MPLYQDRSRGHIRRAELPPRMAAPYESSGEHQISPISDEISPQLDPMYQESSLNALSQLLLAVAPVATCTERRIESSKVGVKFELGNASSSVSAFVSQNPLWPQHENTPMPLAVEHALFLSTRLGTKDEPVPWLSTHYFNSSRCDRCRTLSTSACGAVKLRKRSASGCHLLSNYPKSQPQAAAHHLLTVQSIYSKPSHAVNSLHSACGRGGCCLCGRGPKRATPGCENKLPSSNLSLHSMHNLIWCLPAAGSRGVQAPVGP
jgi:hypothetical protein